eukprot:11190381-Lingulodinium_polyedra.AAC.1
MGCRICSCRFVATGGVLLSRRMEPSLRQLRPQYLEHAVEHGATLAPCQITHQWLPGPTKRPSLMILDCEHQEKPGSETFM